MSIAEEAWKESSARWLIGVDEVGRGCLAGAVYAAAVVFKATEDYSVYKDSKTISEKKRQELAARVSKNHYAQVGFATVEEIDQINIFKASLLAMKRSIEALDLPAGWEAEAEVVVDGKYPIPGLKVRKQYTLIKGDQKCPMVGAASILAKVTRDEEMKSLAERYPHYGFEKHKAYATKAHKEAIEKHGPCEVHRKSFSPIKQMLNWQGV